MNIKHLAVGRKLAAWGWSYDKVTQTIKKDSERIHMPYITEVVIKYGNVNFMNNRNVPAVIITEHTTSIFIN